MLQDASNRLSYIHILRSSSDVRYLSQIKVSKMACEDVYPVDISLPRRLNVYLDWQSRSALICEFLLLQLYIRGQIPEPFAIMSAVDVSGSNSSNRVRQSKRSREMSLFIKSINELKESIHKFCEYQSLRNGAVDTACVMFGVSPRAPKEMYYVYFGDNDENENRSKNNTSAADADMPAVLALSDTRNTQLFNKVKRKMLRNACKTSMGMSTDTNSTKNENENKEKHDNENQDISPVEKHGKSTRGKGRKRLNRKVLEGQSAAFSLDAIPESSLRAVHVGLRCSISQEEGEETTSVEVPYPVECRQTFQWIRKFTPKIWKKKTLPLFVDVHVQSPEAKEESSANVVREEEKENGGSNKRSFDVQCGEWFVQKKKIKTLYRK